MRLYFYCVMKKFWGRNPVRTGMDDQKIFLIKCNDLVAAVSTTKKPSFPDSPDYMKRHEEIIAKFMKNRAILPFRFNCVVGETVGRGILQKYYHALARNLESIKDGVEYRITIVRHNPGAVKKVMNLLDRKTYRDSIFSNTDDGPRTSKIIDIQTKVLATQIHQGFAVLACRHEKNLLETSDVLLRAEYLVEKSTASKFEAEKERVERLYPNVLVMAEGPLPPYNFNSINITEHNNLRFGGPLRTKRA